MRVSVVGTVHENLGCANSSALLAILLHKRPDTIFLEMPASAVGDYLEGSRSTLECIAVTRYREHHQVELIPVDLPTPSKEFFAGIDEVRRTVRTKSAEYCRLVSWDEQYIEAYGFDYLNSSQCSALNADIRAAILGGLAITGDSRLIEHYERFVGTNETRDAEMLTNIEAHCAVSPHKTGVFLVGAAHRRSLFQKASVRSGVVGYPVEWDFLGSV